MRRPVAGYDGLPYSSLAEARLDNVLGVIRGEKGLEDEDDSAKHGPG